MTAGFEPDAVALTDDFQVRTLKPFPALKVRCGSSQIIPAPTHAARTIDKFCTGDVAIAHA
jgi:hypothetical protein